MAKARRITLRRRLWVTGVVVLAASLAIAGAGGWGLWVLDAQVGAALRPYQLLRDAYELGRAVDRARGVTGQAAPDSILAAQVRARDLLRTEPSQPVLQRLEASLRQAGQAPPADRDAHLGAALNAVSELSSRTRADIEHIHRQSQRRRTQAMLLLALGAGLSLLTTTLMLRQQYRAVIDPIRDLTQGVQELRQGRFEHRLEPRGDGELLELADHFNRTADELATLYRGLEDRVRQQSLALAQAERLASVGFLAAGVAHEINNPLSVIRASAELTARHLERSEGDPSAQLRDAAAALRDVADHSGRCAEVCSRLLALAGPGPMLLRPMPIAKVLDQSLALAHRLYGEFEVQQRIDADLWIAGDADLLRQVLLNLLSNALQAYDAPPRAVEVTVSRRLDRAVVRLTDRGRGMTTQELSRVFEPFYSARHDTPSRHGLGLSISHALVRRHQGTLHASSPGPGRGATFTLELPLVGPASSAEAQPVAAAEEAP